MPQSIRFHLDETCRTALANGLRLRSIDVTATPDVGLLGANDPVQLAHGLRLRSIDVTATPDVGLLGANDPVQLAHAHGQGRVFFTHDADFVALHQGGAQHSGIVYCHQYRHPLGEIIRRLVNLWSTREAGELIGQLLYL